MLIGNLKMNNQKICTMKSTAKLCGLLANSGYKNPNLIELYFELFNENLGGVRDAKHDVYNIAKCYWQLRDMNHIE